MPHGVAKKKKNNNNNMLRLYSSPFTRSFAIGQRDQAQLNTRTVGIDSQQAEGRGPVDGKLQEETSGGRDSC